MKKLVVLRLTLVIIFIVFLYFYFHAHDYNLDYEVNDVKVIESFDKKNKYYQFVFKYNNLDYSIIVFDKYTNKRRLIKEIEITENEDEICLIPHSDKLEVYSICSKENELTSANLNDEIKKQEQERYKNFKIYDLNEKSYLLWDYRNFILLNDAKKDEIKLFEKDVYNINMVYAYDNYLIIADYDNTHTFDKVYLIDVKKDKLKEISLRYSVYFDSYFLGTKKKYVYLYDKKQEQEYYINTKKGRIYKTNNKILVNNNWEDISTYKLKEGHAKFYDDISYHYEVIDNKLYSFINEEYKTKISDMTIRTIVKIDGMDVYFISGDTLYYYNPTSGFKALLSYSEWDFNYNNMVFVFD